MFFCHRDQKRSAHTCLYYSFSRPNQNPNPNLSTDQKQVWVGSLLISISEKYPTNGFSGLALNWLPDDLLHLVVGLRRQLTHNFEVRTGGVTAHHRLCWLL